VITATPSLNAELLKNGDSQAVRLPKKYRFTGNEALIKSAEAEAVGDVALLLNCRWFFRSSVANQRSRATS
jgi:hypothetical protein